MGYQLPTNPDSITIAGHTVLLGGTQNLAASDLTNGTTGSGNVVLATSPTISGTATFGTYWQLQTGLGGQNPTTLFFDNTAGFSPDRGSALTIGSTQSATPTGVQATIFEISTGLNGNGSQFVGISNGYLQAQDQQIATFTGSISGTALTASGLSGAVLTQGDGITGSGVTAGTWLVSGSGSSWTVNQSQTVGSTPMTAYSKGVLYGLQLSVAPSIARNNVPYDDADCLVLQNESANGSKGTDCVYIGAGPSFSAGTHQWITGFLIDASADYAFRATGSYNYVFEAGSSTPAGSVFHGPNNVALLSALNAAGSGDILVAEVNTSNNVVIGSSLAINPSTGTATFNSNAFPFSDGAANLGGAAQRWGTVFTEGINSNNGSHGWGIGLTTSSDVPLTIGHDGHTYLELSTSGALQLNAYGAGTLTTDASGNVTASSDERMKNLKGAFGRGMDAIQQIDPVLYSWNADSGLETETTYAGFSAQNVQAAIPEAIGETPDGMLTLADRPILAALVNAVKQLNRRITKHEWNEHGPRPRTAYAMNDPF